MYRFSSFFSTSFVCATSVVCSISWGERKNPLCHVIQSEETQRAIDGRGREGVRERGAGFKKCSIVKKKKKKETVRDVGVDFAWM